MSLYLFEHDVVYDIIFVIFFVIMAVLLCLSAIEIYRSIGITGARKKLNNVRYITGWCLLLQLATFIAHYLHSVAFSAILWNVWIPSWCMGYIKLSYYLSEIRLPSKSNILSNSLRAKSKKQMMIWKIISALWLCCTLSNLIGSLYGYFLHHLDKAYHVQAFCYLLWKLIAFCLLTLCVYILFNIKSTISTTLTLFKPTPSTAPPLPADPNTDSGNSNSPQSTQRNANAGCDLVGNTSTGKVESVQEHLFDLRMALNKINVLIFCEVALSFFFIVSVVYESYVIYKIYRGEYFQNIYAESTVMSMVCYFPLWTLIHLVLLVYGWIPSKPTVPQTVQDLVDYITETPDSRETPATGSSGTGTRSGSAFKSGTSGVRGQQTSNREEAGAVIVTVEGQLQLDGDGISGDVDPESSPIPTLVDVAESNTVVSSHLEMTQLTTCNENDIEIVVGGHDGGGPGLGLAIGGNELRRVSTRSSRSVAGDTASITNEVEL